MKGAIIFMTIGEKRPRLSIPYSVLEKYLEAAGVIAILINIATLLKYNSILPSVIPTHFDDSGNPNKWGNKSAFSAFYIKLAIFYITFTILSQFPHIFNYIIKISKENAMAQYQAARKFMICLKIEIIFIFTYYQWITINVALGKLKGIGENFNIVCSLIIVGTILYHIFKCIKLNDD